MDTSLVLQTTGLKELEQYYLIMQAAQYADEYTVYHSLGEGGQASVYLGSKDNSLYALKVYHPGSSKIDAFKVEADFLAKLNFPHLINMVDHRLEAKVKIGTRPQEQRPLIILELAEGELFTFLSKLGKFIPEVCRTYTKQLIAAIKYLAEVGVAHRDLKPENILFDKDFKLKVADFGLSRDAKGNYGDFRLTSRIGTEGYKPQQMELGNYTGIQCDIFAAGVILFIMYKGTPPFLSTKPNNRVYKLVKDKNFQMFWDLHEKSKPPGYFPDPFKRLMNSFFSAEPDRRPTFESLENDEWMRGDDLMGNELLEYMKTKDDKLKETDKIKQNTAAIRKELFMKKAMEEECCDESRGEEDEENMQPEEIFARNFKALDIQVENLPEYSKKKVVYTKQNPAFMVAWLKDHLAALLRAKETFMTGFVEEIVPNSFNLEYEEGKKQVKISLEFTIGGEEEMELQLVGQLHRSEAGQVGLDWVKGVGHDYWLTAIENSLNGSLQSLV